MTSHPVSGLFPMMDEDALGKLVADIRQNGLREPIWLHPDGRIIDGRNRYVACERAGVTPRFRTWDGRDSLVSFVWSLNGERRHLTAGQRAAAAVAMLPMLEDEARERMAAGGGDKKSGVEIFPPPIEDVGKSREKAAKMTGANHHYVSDAKRIRDTDPETFEAVKTGTMTIPEAKRHIVSKQHDTPAPPTRARSDPDVVAAVMGAIDMEVAGRPAREAAQSTGWSMQTYSRARMVVVLDRHDGLRPADRASVDKAVDLMVGGNVEGAYAAVAPIADRVFSASARAKGPVWASGYDEQELARALAQLGAVCEATHLIHVPPLDATKRKNAVSHVSDCIKALTTFREAIKEA